MHPRIPLRPAGLQPGLALGACGGLVIWANAPAAYGLSATAVTILMILTMIGWGRLLGALARCRLPAELNLLLGVALVALTLALPVMLIGWPILLPAALLLAGLGGWLVRGGVDGTDSELLPMLLCLVVASGFALLWSLEGSHRAAEFFAGGRYRLWLDDFIHAGILADFGDPLSAGRGMSALADAPIGLYHAAGHAIGGLVVAVTGMAPIAAVSGFWVPLGIFLTAVAVFALGRALAGTAGGALALLLLLLLPDVASYGLRQGFFSFHWMMETSPGGLYGLPVALGSIALLALWSRRGGWGLLLLSALMLGAVFLLRAHIFVWALGPWAVTVWLALPWPGRRIRWALLGLGALAAPPALLLIARSEIATLGVTGFVTRYINHLHIAYVPTGYDGLYPWLTAQLGPWGALPIGLLLALAGMGGVWLLTFLLGLFIAAWRRKLEMLDAFPIALLLWVVVLMLFAPTPFHNDFTDFRQRAFVLVYAVLIIWTARYALLLLPRLARPGTLALGAVLTLGSMVFWLPGAKSPRMTNLAQLRENAIRPGLLEVAQWLRAQAAVNESFLLAGQQPDTVWFDDATLILGTSGLPAWLSRPGVHRLAGPPRASIAEQRLASANAIQAELDAGRALARLREAGIAFYLTLADAPPAWDPRAEAVAFRAGDFLVWRVPR